MYIFENIPYTSPIHQFFFTLNLVTPPTHKYIMDDGGCITHFVIVSDHYLCKYVNICLDRYLVIYKGDRFLTPLNFHHEQQHSNLTKSSFQ